MDARTDGTAILLIAYLLAIAVAGFLEIWRNGKISVTTQVLFAGGVIGVTLFAFLSD
jgi:hypothetical protein